MCYANIHTGPHGAEARVTGKLSFSARTQAPSTLPLVGDRGRSSTTMISRGTFHCANPCVRAEPLN